MVIHSVHRYDRKTLPTDSTIRGQTMPLLDPCNPVITVGAILHTPSEQQSDITVRALNLVEVLILTQDALEELEESWPDAHTQLVAFLSNSINTTTYAKNHAEESTEMKQSKLIPEPSQTANVPTVATTFGIVTDIPVKPQMSRDPSLLPSSSNAEDPEARDSIAPMRIPNLMRRPSVATPQPRSDAVLPAIRPPSLQRRTTTRLGFVGSSMQNLFAAHPALAHHVQFEPLQRNESTQRVDRVSHRQLPDLDKTD